MKARIYSRPAGFFIEFNDIALSPELNQTHLAMRKDGIQEIMLNKPELSGYNMPTVSYTLPSGREYITHAGIVESGEENGVITWFTTEGTEGGTPDTQLLYEWVKDKWLQ